MAKTNIFFYQLIMPLAEAKGHLLNLKRHRKHLDREGSGICGFKLILSSCLDENLCRLFSVTYFFLKYHCLISVRHVVSGKYWHQTSRFFHLLLCSNLKKSPGIIVLFFRCCLQSLVVS